jgi:hypothetical protein
VFHNIRNLEELIYLSKGVLTEAQGVPNGHDGFKSASAIRIWRVIKYLLYMLVFRRMSK